jgi:Trp operon repressor
VPIASDKELIWAAGLFVGEGCAYLHKQRGYNYPGLTIMMYDQRAMERFRNAVLPYVGQRVKSKQVGININPASVNGERRGYVITIVGRPAEGVFAALMPWMENTDKGDQVLRILRTAEESLDSRPVCNQSRKLNRTAVSTMRRLYSQGKASQRELARRFGVSQATIQGVLARKTWQ